MKEKFAMTSIMASTFGDVATTMFVLSQGGEEVGLYAHKLYEHSLMPEAYAVKIGVSAALIAIYALTAKDSKTNSWAWGYDKVMKVMSVAMWYYPVANMIGYFFPGH